MTRSDNILRRLGAKSKVAIAINVRSNMGDKV